MTNREIFEIVKTHLLSQNEKAQIGHTCKYRLEKDGKILRCAVGCLIPDEDYNPKFEGLFISQYGDNLVGNYFFSKGFTEDNINFLYRLQKIHDDYPLITWEDQLNQLEREI